MNPLFPPANLTVAFLFLAGFLAVLAWKSAAVCPLPARGSITVFRFLGVLALSIPFFNPGSWRQPPETRSTFYAVLLDRSGSMQSPHEGDVSRWSAALDAVSRLGDSGASSPVEWKFFPFSAGLEPEVSRAALAQLEPDGTDTALIRSITQLVDRFATSDPALGGILVLGDGKETVEMPMEEAVARCRAAQVPVFALPLGEPEAKPDLRIAFPRRSIVAFRGQEILIPVDVTTERLSASRIPVVVRNAKTGEELLTHSVDMEENQTRRIALRLDAMGDGNHELKVEAVAPEELGGGGRNRGIVHLQILDRAVRVLMVEGSPYWDTKFIAQLLQSEADYEFELVYRLSEDRFFSVEGGSEDVEDEDREFVERSVFPTTKEELSSFDLLIFGKNVDPFLDSERIGNLREWIEQGGGTVVLARGNPLTTNQPALEALFPTDWDLSWETEFRWRPTRAGEETGLFGTELPGSEDPIWQILPELRQADYGARLRAFSQVLVEGSAAVGDRAVRFPAVVSRRVGEGLVLSINTGDLWRWDFFPQVPEAEKIYRDFWFQLFHWSVAYSEFLPGKDFSLRLSRSRVPVGTPTRIRVSRRSGRAPDAEPMLRITDDAGGEQVLAPQPVSGNADAWETLFVPENGGEYRVTLEVEGAGPEAELLLPLLSIAPPSELEDTDPDLDFLAALTEATGGAMLSREDLAYFPPEPPEIREDAAADPVWEPSWTHWKWFLPMLGFFVLEWFVRRRNGLI